MFKRRKVVLESDLKEICGEVLADLLREISNEILLAPVVKIPRPAQREGFLIHVETKGHLISSLMKVIEPVAKQAFSEADERINKRILASRKEAIREAKTIADNRVKALTDYYESEKFLDQVINRIKSKQL